MEKGLRAFVSYIRAYKEHHCSYIFRSDALLIATSCSTTLSLPPSSLTALLSIGGKSLKLENWAWDLAYYSSLRCLRWSITLFRLRVLSRSRTSTWMISSSSEVLLNHFFVVYRVINKLARATAHPLILAVVKGLRSSSTGVTNVRAELIY